MVGGDRVAEILEWLGNQHHVAAARRIKSMEHTALDRIGDRDRAAQQLSTREIARDSRDTEGRLPYDLRQFFRIDVVAFERGVVEVNVSIYEALA